LGSSLSCLLKLGAADALKPDSEGYIRHWLMLAPIALPEGATGSDAIFKEQIKDEAALRPQAGDKVKLRGKELTWQNITATTKLLRLQRNPEDCEWTMPPATWSLTSSVRRSGPT
jgi:hypothetical protein